MRNEGKTNWPNRGSWSVVKLDSHHDESLMLECATDVPEERLVAGGSAPPRIISDRVGFVDRG